MMTSTIDPAILQKLEFLTRRVEQLEQKVFNPTPDSNGTHDPIVATFDRDNQIYEIRQSEVATLRSSMIKEYPDRILHKQLLIKKMADYRAEHYTHEESRKEFIDALHTIRAQAMIDGTAIDEDWEAAIDD